MNALNTVMIKVGNILEARYSHRCGIAGHPLATVSIEVGTIVEVVKVRGKNYVLEICKSGTKIETNGLSNWLVC